MFNFQNKTVIVTGSTRGIGKAIAKSFIDAGANVIITGTTEEGVSKTAAELGPFAKGIKCNVAKKEEVVHLVATVLSEFKKIDILVNNAGITKDTLIMRMKDEDWDSVMDINLKGTFLITREVITAMMKAREGRIINMASVVGIMGNAGQTNYAATKGGLIAFTKSLAREVASRNITVNAVAPGFIESDMTETLNESIKEGYVSMIPMKRFGSTVDIANATMFLASEYSGYVTGQVLSVNGGMLMP